MFLTDYLLLKKNKNSPPSTPFLSVAESTKRKLLLSLLASLTGSAKPFQPPVLIFFIFIARLSAVFMAYAGYLTAVFGLRRLVLLIKLTAVYGLRRLNLFLAFAGVLAFPFFPLFDSRTPVYFVKFCPQSVP